MGIADSTPGFAMEKRPPSGRAIVKFMIQKLIIISKDSTPGTALGFIVIRFTFWGPLPARGQDVREDGLVATNRNDSLEISARTGRHEK
ncbi:hypothetical protein ZHAS_00015941 [Anopheles sinensis]|uniref:Uncharacterized protein n=1 Tax=Anopheles sinensis TaxID=74873 RepID=A0A084WCE1_ANOSI|nr:hypothetical protein ZHAS_00015941 [Anopheles sinensis]